MRPIVAEKIAGQITEWGHRGLIDSALGARLQQRYQTELTLGQVLLRWLGFFALFMLGTSVLGLVGMVMGDLMMPIASVLLGVVAGAMWLKGATMAADPQQLYPMSGAVLLTTGLIGGLGAFALLYGAVGGNSHNQVFPVIMLLVAGGAFGTAYRYGLRWPLVLAMLLLFHGIGNWHAYGGHGSYFLGIRDERLTLVLGIVTIGAGLWHELAREQELSSRSVGFGHIYVVFGLIYANLSIWFLSLMGRDLSMVMAFTAACIAQIIIGARLHDGRFIGFGIVFLSINLYTRLFEGFWDELSKGTFFLLSGVIAMALGAVFEHRASQRKSVA